MDNTKYLRDLEKQGKLPELLDALGLPSKQFKLPDQGCRIYFSTDADTNMNCLVVETWDSDDLHFSSLKSVGNNTCKLNDYMFLAGVKDHGQKRLQKLFEYMKENFYEFEGRENAYQEDCINYLADQQRQRQEALQAECDKKKLDVEYEIGEKMMLVIDGKQ